MRQVRAMVQHHPRGIEAMQAVHLQVETKMKNILFPTVLCIMNLALWSLHGMPINLFAAGR
jgi:hypothetical protein